MKGWGIIVFIVGFDVAASLATKLHDLVVDMWESEGSLMATSIMRLW